MKLTLLIFACAAFAQNAFLQWKESSPEEFSKAILASESKIAPGTSYSMDMVYSFFNDPQTHTPEVKMSGDLICEAGKNYSIRQLDRLIVQDENINVTCDSAARMIILKDADTNFSAHKTLESYALFLRSECRVKKQQTGKKTSYSIEFAPGARYQSAEVHLNEAQQLERYVLYAGMDVEDDTQGEEVKLIRPRLEISYTNYRFGASVPTAKMHRVAEFLQTGNGQYTLTPAYQGFELVDLRTQKH